MARRKLGKINALGLILLGILMMAAWFLMPALQVNAKEMEEKNYKADELIVKFKPGVTEEEKDKIHEKHGSKKIKEFRSLKVDHVKLKKGLDPEKTAEAYMAEPEVEYAEPNYLFTTQTIPDDVYFTYLWSLRNTGQTGELLTQISMHPRPGISRTEAMMLLSPS